jgi:hypothetical protein
LVPASWLGVVGARRALAGTAAGAAPEGPVLASSPLVTVAWADRWKELGSRCGGSPTWSCLATLAAADGTPDAVSWPGGLKVGWDPAQEALAGPAVLGQMAVALSGGASVASNDLDDPLISGPLDALAAARPNPGTAANSPLGQMLTFGRSRLDLVGTVRAGLGPTAPPDVVVAPAAPGARLDLVLATLPGRPGVPEARRRALADALAAAGWEAPAPAGAADGLPSGGTLEALRQRWP